MTKCHRLQELERPTIMANRHHSSHKRHPASYHSSEGDYSGEYARRTQEMQDAGMIHEDRSAIANLPQNVMIKPYEKTGPYMPEGLDDSIRGVDHQMDMDDSKRRSHNVPKKV